MGKLKTTKEECLAAITSSDFLKEVIQKLSVSYRTYNKAIETYFLFEEDYQLRQRSRNSIGRKNRKMSKLTFEDIFKEDSSVSAGLLRKQTLFHRILPYVCATDNCLSNLTPGMWNDKPMIYELDHINGNRNDNRIENLRFLCSICHTQTETFKSKNLKKSLRRVPYYCDCGKEKNKNSLRCKNCSVLIRAYDSVREQELAGYKLKPLKFEVSKEELEKLLAEMPMTKIGEMFNVSDNAIKKRAKKLGIELLSRRGHWAKVYASKSKEVNW